VFTASQEQGGIYREDRHLRGNFCRRGWAEKLAKRFPGVQFDQVILDYFWIPSGWDASHWTRSFFKSTLPDLCRLNLLRRRDCDNDGSLREGPCVHLPFGFHCFQMVLACRDTLLRFYDVFFIRKHEIARISLWRGTQAIDQLVMQSVLGKRLDQEEVYCRMGDLVQKIQAQETSSLISPHDLLSYARRIPNVDEIRFITLQPVAENAVVDAVRARGLRSNEERLPGRIMGLIDPPAKRCLIFPPVKTASPAPQKAKAKRQRPPAKRLITPCGESFPLLSRRRSHLHVKNPVDSSAGASPLDFKPRASQIHRG
jgi:hypothetical protein